MGDRVFTFDENGENFGSYLVEKTFKGKTDKWYKITTVYGNNVIKCSPTHLFMVDGQEKQAQELSTNDKLSMLIDNFNLESREIKSIELINEEIDIYNIEVAVAHTYFTENLVWHHNKVLLP